MAETSLLPRIDLSPMARAQASVHALTADEMRIALEDWWTHGDREQAARVRWLCGKAGVVIVFDHDVCEPSIRIVNVWRV